MNTQPEALRLADEFDWWVSRGLNLEPRLADAAAELRRLHEENERLKAAQQQEPVNKYCCHLCFNKSGQMFLDRMILCPECGNKRCPKATYHELPCTNSNEPGQPGSIYTSPPASKPWVGLTEYERADVYKAIPAKEFCVDAVGIAIEAKLREKNQ